MSQSLLISLSQQDVNIKQLAQDFSHQYTARPTRLYIELSNITCYSCKIPSFPVRMIENGDLTAIDAFLRQWLDPSTRARDTISNLQSQEYWPNVLTFFHHLIFYEWDLLTAATKFDSFFAKFLSILASAELPSLRYFGSAVQLELISVCAREKNELLRGEHRADILEYAVNILTNSFHDFERKIWAQSLSQMRLWFQSDASLLEPSLLRFLLWGLTDRWTANFRRCLQISVELLDEHYERRVLLVNFIQSLLPKLSITLATDDIDLFAQLCDLAVVLYHKYLTVSPSRKFVDMLLRFIFATERTKAKAAANVFLHTKLQDAPALEQLRRIAQFLALHNSVFVELFVDAMIDDYPLLTDWDTLMQALRQLADSERETLLLVILCAVNLVEGAKPFIRTERSEVQAPADFRATVTSAFAPLLSTLSSENAHFRWKLMVVKLAKYFDFERVQETHMAAVLREYMNTFTGGTGTFDMAQLTIMLELVFIILEHNRYDYLNDQVVNLKMRFEAEFEDLVRRLNESQSVNVTTSMNVVLGMYALRNIVVLDEKCLFNIPVQLLEEEAKSDDLLLAVCQEMAIMLSSDYVVELLNPSDSSRGEVRLDVEKTERIKLVFHVVCDCLNRQYLSRTGELAFFALCRMVKALFSGNASEWQRNSVFTEVVGHSLCAYVALALRNVQFALSPPYELSTYSLENMVAQFAELILSGVLPMTHAYELLHAHCHQTSRLEKELRSFLVEAVERKSANDVAQWIFAYFAEYFRMADEDLLNDLAVRAKRLCQLLKSTRSSLADVVKYVHKLGIDFAVSRVETKGLGSVKFLVILVEFSPCLSAGDKESCFEYFRKKQIVDNVDVAKLYFNSVRVKKKQSIQAESSESEEVDDVEMEPVMRRSRLSIEDSRTVSRSSERSQPIFSDSSQ